MTDHREGDPLGRLYIPDERDQNYPLRPQATDFEGREAVERGYRYWWADGWWGDQWYTPQCVAYAWIHWLEDGPTTHAPRAPQRRASVMAQGAALLHPDNLYREAQRIDQWPGENYDGTSVRAGADVLRRNGLIREYRWAWDLETVIQAILTEGPLVVGTNWYEQMFYPDAEEGFIEIGGSIAGGHAYELNGVNTERRVFRIKNSWGRDWGKTGHAWISFDDMERLLDERGDACMAFEVSTDLDPATTDEVVSQAAARTPRPPNPAGFQTG